MPKLNWVLWRLQKNDREGLFVTRRDRSYALAQPANTLHDLSYRQLWAKGLKGKHIEALVRDWFNRDLSMGTIANRMAYLRWWAARVGKPNAVKPNVEYGIVGRSVRRHEEP